MDELTISFQELNQRLSHLKDQVNELHYDVVLQRGPAHTHFARVESVMREGLLLELQLERRHSEMVRIRKHLESIWNDSVRQIRMEQEIFQSQVLFLLSLFKKYGESWVADAIRQLLPYHTYHDHLRFEEFSFTLFSLI